jgi:hypothetical protein
VGRWRLPKPGDGGRYPLTLNIRQAIPGDGTAIARVVRDGAAFYVGVAPGLFRMSDDDGLVEFAEPSPEDNSPTTLFIVAEIDDEIVGHLYAELIAPGESDRFQSPSDMNEVRLFIQALSVMQDHWRRGVGNSASRDR